MPTTTFVSWNPFLSVGVKSLDSQHQVLIEMINRLYNAGAARASADEIKKIFDQLVDYTRFHFTSEERLLARIAYPDLDVQKREHEQLLSKLVEVQGQLQAGSGGVTSQVLAYLRDWWLNHIPSEDKPYAHYLNRKGIF